MIIINDDIIEEFHWVKAQADQELATIDDSTDPQTKYNVEFKHEMASKGIIALNRLLKYDPLDADAPDVEWWYKIMYWVIHRMAFSYRDNEGYNPVWHQEL